MYSIILEDLEGIYCNLNGLHLFVCCNGTLYCIFIHIDDSTVKTTTSILIGMLFKLFHWQIYILNKSERVTNPNKIM